MNEQNERDARAEHPLPVPSRHATIRRNGDQGRSDGTSGVQLMNDQRPMGRKFRKFRQSPRLFLNDAKNPALRILRLFVETGWPENKPLRASGFSATALQAMATRASTPPRELIERSGLFDGKYYFGRHPDLRKNGVKDPLDHYVRHGMSEGRSPNELFDPAFYAKNAGLSPQDSPLIHYILEGELKGLRPHPNFDPTYYVAQNPEAATGPLAHYLSVGRREGRPPSSTVRDDLRIRQDQDLGQVPVTVLIPVYNNAQHVRRCIESVLTHTRMPRAELLLIDDASTDAATQRMLAGYADAPKVTLLRNDENLGFTRTVNRGLLHAQGRDVVLLNSDTVVSPRWLENLALVAYGARDIATATALSDNAGAFSTPKVPSNDTHAVHPVDIAARLSARSANAELHVVPTGNGFCMYMRRDAIDDVGLLDDLHFPRGYGEENDWCMRAGERGWRHAIALRAYVHHVNAVSFGSDAKALLREEARLQLEQLHPDYAPRVKRAFGEGTPLAAQREAMRHAASGPPPRPRVMFVVSTPDGGTPQTNEDLMRGLANVYDALLLSCDSSEMKLVDWSLPARPLLAQHSLSERVNVLSHDSHEYDSVVTSWMARFGVELLHIRHIAWHSLGLVRAARRQCIPVVFSFHDFYTMCPSVNLTNGKDPWCDTGVTTPHICAPLWVRRDREGLAAVHAGAAEPFLALWKRRMNAMLSQCDAFVTTSPTVRNVLSKNLPVLRQRSSDFHLIPHGRDFQAFAPPSLGPAPNSPIKVLLIGNISQNKGLGTVSELLALDAEGVIELHTMGTSPGAELKRAVHHGPYTRSELMSRIATVAPHVGLIPTICPETHCHTLTECWAAGLPVVGSNLGAVGERIRQSGAGWEVDPRDAAGILELLRNIRSGAEPWAPRAEAVRNWQRTTGSQQTVAAMSANYADVYMDVLQRRRPFREAGRRTPKLPPRIAVLAQGRYPSSFPTAHVRMAGPLRSASGDVNYEWVDAASLVHQGVRDFDGVIVCRNAAGPAALSEVARQCRRKGTALVLDLDDDLLHIPDERDPKRVYARVKPALRELLQTAELLTVSTTPLQTVYAPLTKKTQLVPNRLDPHLWGEPVERGLPPQDFNAQAALHVLYMGSPTHDEDVALIERAFARLSKKHRVQLYTIGVTERPIPGVIQIAVPTARYDRFIPWLRAVAQHFDVAVAPLAETPFNRCKSNLKFLEYAACGLAVVASRVTPYAETIRDGEDGLLVANDDDSWFRAVESLALSPELRRKLARTALARAQREFISSSCVFDTLPWHEWSAAKLSSTPSNGGHDVRREVDSRVSVWEA
jgi:O-antigen biosynthesis protein